MVEEQIEIKLLPYGEKYNGKHSGWAYQLLDDDYNGVYKGVCCKDYLIDQIYSDLTKNSLRAYGQSSSYKGIFDKQEYLKLCVYPYFLNQKKNPIIENLSELGENLQLFLNEIELLREFDLSTVEVIDNKMLITFNKQWISKPWLFSLFTFLCRVGIYYDGNMEEYIKQPFKAENIWLDVEDRYNFTNQISPKIMQILNNEAEIVQDDWKDISGWDNVHNDSGFFSSLYKIKILENVS